MKCANHEFFPYVFFSIFFFVILFASILHICKPDRDNEQVKL